MFYILEARLKMRNTAVDSQSIVSWKKKISYDPEVYVSFNSISVI